MPESHQLADQLQALKERSGRSYSALAHRTGLSRSSVHRYCQGLTVPASFGTVERIARVCGVSQDELDRLYAAWVRAEQQSRADQRDAQVTQPNDAQDPQASGSDPTVDPEHAPTTTPDATDPEEPQPPGPTARFTRSRLHPPRPERPRLRLRTLLAVAFVAAFAVVSYAVFAPSPPPPTPSPTAEPESQHLVGPDWHMTPQRIDPEFFGMTMNTDTGRMPGFRVSGIRLWDGETRWGQVEPERGTFDWSVLERMVDGAERADLPVLFTFGGTPGWAAPDSPHTVYGDGTRTAPPDDLADWDRFVTKVATRYRQRIDAYELWDNVGATSHYSGDLRTLAAMVHRASRIIGRIDPDAVVACPSFGRLWERQGQELLRKFAATGAYESCDAAAVKLHPRRADGPPEEIIELATKVQDGILYGQNVGLPLWNTGPGQDIVTRPQLGARRAQDYAVRFYLAGLFSRKAKLDRMYFYSWGSTRLPLVVQPVGGEPTEAALRIGRLQDWLSGKRITSCGRGVRVGLPEGVYECRFVRGSDRAWTAIRWTRSGRATTTLDADAHRLRRLDGHIERVRPGQRVEYDETPVLVEYTGP